MPRKGCNNCQTLPGASFSKVLKLFEPTIPSTSTFATSNIAIPLVFFNTFKNYEKISFLKHCQVDYSLTTGFPETVLATFSKDVYNTRQKLISTAEAFLADTYLHGARERRTWEADSPTSSIFHF